jgi:hypothetical protein
MIALLIIAGFIGILAPILGFVVLFIGAMFLASWSAGITSLILVVMLLVAMIVMGFTPKG